MWESPIQIYQDEVARKTIEKLEGTVVDAIYKVGVNVNKEELIKALKYDRNQYEKGYYDGFSKLILDGYVKVVRCKDCKHFLPYAPCVGGTYEGCNRLDGIDGSPLDICKDFYCAYGERRTDETD